MAEELLDKLADDTVSGLKGFLAHRINNGEDPTTCMRMFLSFLESNKEKNPQFFKKIASRIDSGFFAPLKEVNQIAFPDDFITTYHNLVNKLIEINQEMPYKADYERQKGLIENEKNPIRERLRKGKEEKKRFVDNEYKKNGSGKGLRRFAVFCFIIFAVLLLVDILSPRPRSEDSLVVFAVVGAVVGAIALGMLFAKLKWGGCNGVVAGYLGGAGVGAGLGAIFVWAPPYLVFLWLVLGIILALIYGFKVAAIQLTPDESSAYNTSLENIEEHFSDKEKYEIIESALKILATDNQ